MNTHSFIDSKGSPVIAESAPGKDGFVQLFTVIRVIDGDTIVVKDGSKRKKIRLIGIDAPEKVNSQRTKEECYGREASDRIKVLAAGKKIIIEADQSLTDKDPYGRFLRYVWTEDGTFLNEEMLKEGYAYRYSTSSEYKFKSEFEKAEKGAKESGAGLWSSCPISQK